MTARKYTNELINNVEQGVLSWETVARACLNYMSEADVEDMATSEGLIFEDDGDGDDE